MPIIFFFFKGGDFHGLLPTLLLTVLDPRGWTGLKLPHNDPPSALKSDLKTDNCKQLGSN